MLLGEAGEAGEPTPPGGGFRWVMGGSGGGAPSSMVAASEGSKAEGPLAGVCNGCAGGGEEEPLSGTKVAAS